MNRASFLKSLFVVAAAPKIISEINLSPVVKNDTWVLADLQALTPQYYQKYVEKYANFEYEWWLSTYVESTESEHKNAKEFFFNETGRLI